ncbi:hypothetical protein HRI_004639200 [Hibiscus trionum]|uniref:PB1 domain-containing protein n=1 Tax=Hibiscus trionum TaxID=183268 RepID=A0A9W7MSF9_HIBTR|nr:hypothetical protein HRI_004639200 [Hibiscus trionum]
MAGPNSTTIKFLCSYRGQILPRYPDGKLRYHGGETRVLAVNRSISFSELSWKMGAMCGTSVNLRCQLPTHDLDVLVSISTDEELRYIIEEYDRSASSPESLVKIKAFLSSPKSARKSTSQPSPSSSSSSTSSSNSSISPKLSCVRQMIPRSPSVVPHRCSSSKTSVVSNIACHGYQVHHPNHIQINLIPTRKHLQWRC